MKKLSIIIIVLVAILVCCKKTPEVNIKYVDVEREVLTIGSTTANIQCDYEYIATLKSAKLYYGRTEDNMNYVNMRVVQSVLYAEITGLESNTNYKYYYEFENGFNSMQSGVKTFTTEENPTTVVLPTVITADVTEITSESAVSGGEVISDGGGNVTSRGVCWSTSPNPAIEDSFTTDGDGIGSFVSNLTGLSDNTTYHVRAYATNEAGTAYGMDKEFATLNGGGEAPTGAINGLFTINANGDQVYFSQGNLQYQASTNTWRFAENQWDYVGSQYPSYNQPGGGTINGSDNKYISSNYNGWIDLFGWGTSGYDHGAVSYQPWSTSFPDKNYFAYGQCLNNLNDQTGKADWGYNAISNGGNAENLWRTLTKDEWTYVFSTRNTSSGIRYVKAKINGVGGILLLPDTWNSNIYSFNSTNTNNSTFNTNEIVLASWNALESSGAVFLPVTGERLEDRIYNVYCDGVCSRGHYWSATQYNTSYSPQDEWFQSYRIIFDETCLEWDRCWNRDTGFGVRLVQDANK